MSIRITIQVTCDTPEDAKDAINRLTRPKTWVDQLDDSPSPEKPQPFTATPLGRPNTDPGSSSIGKMGGATKNEILELLGAGKVVPVKYAEHLKLLWQRGEVKFDGTNYYL